MGLDPNSTEKRKATRTRVIDSQLITVDLGDGNSGLMVDAAEWGIAVQAVAAPPVGSQRTVSFQLPGSNVRISAQGRVAWKDDSNQLGFHFVQVSDMQRKIMRKWLEEVERETTEAMIEWDTQSSGKAVVVPEENPPVPASREDPVLPQKQKSREPLPEPAVEPPHKTTEPPRDPFAPHKAHDPFAPKTRDSEQEPTWDPFAPRKRETPKEPIDREYETARYREPAVPAIPAASRSEDRQPAASKSLAAYEPPRYYSPTPPPLHLPEGAVAVVEPPKVTHKPARKVHPESTPKARFEKWVIEKHEGSAVEKLKTAVALLLMVFGFWLFVKLLPPIAAELRYDWNKFAVAFNLPSIGDGRTGPPVIQDAQYGSPAYPAPLPQAKTEVASATSGVQPSRPVSRKAAGATATPIVPPSSGAVFVPSFGAGSSSYRLRLADGIAPGKLLYQVRPVYPEVARARRPDPRVALRAVVDNNGRVIGAQVIRGDAALSAAAMQAIRQWRYEPYRVAGKPVEVEARIDIDFSKLQ